MMTRAELLSTMEGILADVLDNDALQLSESMTAEDVPDWDSINHVKLLNGLEEELNLRFKTEEIEGLKNVGTLIDLLQKKLKT